MSSTSTSTESRTPEEAGGAEETGLTLVDWIVAIAMALLASTFVVVGSVVFQGADTALIDRLIAEGLLVSDVFTEAELADVTYSLAWWSGIGFIATGVAVFVADGWYVLRRRREVRTATTGLAGAYAFAPSALVGAIASYLTGFVPGSPVIGGAVAAYLHTSDRSGAVKVGAVSGLLAAAPILLLLTVVFGALVVASFSIDVAAGGVLFAGIYVFTVVLTTVLFVGLSAGGGYLGAVVAGSGR